MIVRRLMLLLPLSLVICMAAAPCVAQPAEASPADGASLAEPAAPGAWPDAPVGARVRELGWFPPRSPAVAPPALPEEITRAFIIPIHGDIRSATAEIVERKIVQAKAKGAEIVIFDMDTLGGRSDAADAICNAITEELANIYTVAYVNPRALSAGAIISLACDEIITVRGGLIGDAMPIMMGPEGIQEMPKVVRGKYESFDRGRVRVLAESNGYDVTLCEGMITLAIELWLFRNADTGELRIVDVDKESPEAPWQRIARVDSPDELVTFTGSEAYQIGLADHILTDYGELRALYNITAEPVTLEMTWSEELAYVISSMAVTSLLMGAGIMLIFVEIRTPGFGIAGIGALLCFAMLFGGRYIIGLAQWWEIGLIVLGMVLLMVEIVLIPGFGWAGISGSICLLAGLLAIIVPNAPTEWPFPVTASDWRFFTSGLMALGLGFIVALVGTLLLMQYLPRLPITSRLALAEAEHYDEPTVAAGSPLVGVAVGDVGVVETMCRPVGKVRFGQELLDAAAEGDYIDVGREVRLVRVDGNRLVVERINEA